MQVGPMRVRRGSDYGYFAAQPSGDMLRASQGRPRYAGRPAISYADSQDPIEEHTVSAKTDPKREFLRHAVATLAYRGGKVLRDVPDNFASFRVGETTRTPSQILAHVGDLLDWAVSLALERRNGTTRLLCRGGRKSHVSMTP